MTDVRFLLIASEPDKMLSGDTYVRECKALDPLGITRICVKPHAITIIDNIIDSKIIKIPDVIITSVARLGEPEEMEVLLSMITPEYSGSILLSIKRKHLVNISSNNISLTDLLHKASFVLLLERPIEVLSNLNRNIVLACGASCYFIIKDNQRYYVEDVGLPRSLPLRVTRQPSPLPYSPERVTLFIPNWGPKGIRTGGIIIMDVKIKDNRPDVRFIKYVSFGERVREVVSRPLEGSFYVLARSGLYRYKLAKYKEYVNSFFDKLVEDCKIPKEKSDWTYLFTRTKCPGCYPVPLPWSVTIRSDRADIYFFEKPRGSVLRRISVELLKGEEKRTRLIQEGKTSERNRLDSAIRLYDDRRSVRIADLDNIIHVHFILHSLNLS